MFDKFLNSPLYAKWKKKQNKKNIACYKEFTFQLLNLNKMTL